MSSDNARTNGLSGDVLTDCAVAFCLAAFYIVRRYRREKGVGTDRTAYCLLTVQNQQ